MFWNKVTDNKTILPLYVDKLDKVFNRRAAFDITNNLRIKNIEMDDAGIYNCSHKRTLQEKGKYRKKTYEVVRITLKGKRNIKH